MAENPSAAEKENAMDELPVGESLKHAMRALAKAVVLIACRSAAGERFVMPATAVTPVSMDPPSMLICVNRSVSSYPVLATGVAFSVSILATSQLALAQLCTGGGNSERRFSLGDWRNDGAGTPYLADALAAIVCEQDHRVSYGTHDVFFGRARRIVVNSVEDPLIYANGLYQRLGGAIGP